MILVNGAARDYITPIMDQAELGPGLTESPCRRCAHRKEDKNVCRLRPDCPIRIPTKLLGKHKAPNDYVKKRRARSRTHEPRRCAWPGCQELVTSGEYCLANRHTYIYSQRKRRWPDNPEKWFLPVLSRKEKKNKWKKH